MIASNYTVDENVLVAALLHDVLEDVEMLYIEKETIIQDRFGLEVLEMVRGVSEETDPLQKINKISWKERKLKYIERLERDSEGSLIICAADKIHNLMSLLSGYNEEGEEMWNRFNASNGEKLWFYEEVLKVLERKLSNPIVEEFRSWLEQVRVIT